MVRIRTLACFAAVLLSASAAADAARPAATAQSPSRVLQTPGQVAPQTPVPPPDYVIGADDVLTVMFRQNKEMSADVVVRPDGKVTLQLLDDIQAAGLTPEQFRDKVTESTKRFFEGDPSVTVVVKQINSRKVFVTGQVRTPGAYPIGTRLTIVQLLAMAGGLTEFAKEKDIVIVRDAPGGATRPGATPTTYHFNYRDIRNLKKLSTNIDLKPGDTVIVP